MGWGRRRKTPISRSWVVKIAVLTTHQLCLTYQLSGLSCPAGSITRNVLIGGRWGGVYPGLRGWKVERRLVIMVLKLFTLSKTVLRSAYFFRTRLDWARWDSSLVQGPTRSSGFILHKEKGHFINQWNLHPLTPFGTQQSYCIKQQFSKYSPLGLWPLPTTRPWKAAWALDTVLALSRQSYDNTRLISDSVFLSVRYGAELPVFGSKTLLPS